MGMDKKGGDMKHAVLLLWHKDVEQLKELLRFFDADFAFYIHIDRKSTITSDVIGSLHNIHPKIKIWSKYKVFWGGIGILEAELFLLEKIVRDGDFDYIHFMSGQDYPIKPLDAIKKFFKEHKGEEFVEYMPLPDEKWEYRTYSRFELYRLNDYMDYHAPKGYKWINRINAWQQRLGIKRPIPNHFPRLYGGSNWMSITLDCAWYIVNNRRQNRNFFRRLRFTVASDEVYFHTVILNSPFADKVMGNNLRLTIWNGNGSSPVILTEKYWWEVATTDRLIARKVDRNKSSLLLNNLHRYILYPNDISIAGSGYWTNNSLKGHVYDNGLAVALLKLLPFLYVKTIADFGCGPGWYVALLRRNGYDTQGYDGNPAVEEMSSLFFDDGFYCQNIDLTEELEAEEPFDMVMSLEVGEHIPKQWESFFFDNLTRNANHYILLSWAVEAQPGDGHVNCHSNEYVVSQMKNRGYTLNCPVSRYLRKSASLWWFKNTLMLFERR